MSLTSQKQRLVEQVNAVLVATTKTFGHRDRNYFVSFRQAGFPLLSIENWLIAGVSFVNDRVVLIDEREQYFYVNTAFDSTDLDQLLEIADKLHAQGISAAPELAAQYCELLKENKGASLLPVTVVFHQDNQHLSSEESTLDELSPDALRQLVLQQGAWPVDETKPVEFSIYSGDDADIEWVSGALHPSFILQ
jgi:hypothetical protein